MILQIQKTSEKAYLATISLDQIVWGTLPARVLLSLYPVPCTMQIDFAQAEELQANLLQAAQNRLLDYLAKFEHSEYQARLFLQKYRFHRSIIDSVIAEARERKYLDDSRFAEIFVRSLAERNKSRNFIIGKLYEQHIQPEIYQPFLDEYLLRDEQNDYLKREIARLMQRHSDKSPREQREKIIASLYRKGYDLDQIKEALRD